MIYLLDRLPIQTFGLIDFNRAEMNPVEDFTTVLKTLSFDGIYLIDRDKRNLASAIFGCPVEMERGNHVRYAVGDTLYLLLHEPNVKTKLFKLDIL